MAPVERPEDLIKSLVPTESDLASLGSVNLDAVHVVERCIGTHHVVELDHIDEESVERSLLEQPAFIRTSSAHHVVLWAIPVGMDHWEELRLDRVRAARDTGEEFVPSW
ncbi:MAG TPA: hypothetical protein VIO62_06185 [Candidatus Dormibacteraeota bacterium]